MASTERIREVFASPPGPDYLKDKTEQGWRLVAVEWEREAEGEAAAGVTEDVPYGLRVAGDCLHLEGESNERDALTLMLKLIAEDRSLSQVAEELNRKGFSTRPGSGWTQKEVFNMLPRLIEVAPQILASDEWTARGQHATSPS
jgi:hypothetical protein